MPFRKWELFELPSLRKTKTDVWPIKTSTNLEKPRYVIVTFQTARKDSLTADASKFDHASLTNLKLHLNADSFPYDNMNLQINENKYAAAYRMYASFQSSYYNVNNQPLLSYEKFKECALYVIDCANQKEAVKSSIVDVKLMLYLSDCWSLLVVLLKISPLTVSLYMITLLSTHRCRAL
ncbi:hypothetical protein QE152_g4863 [Popillia japonica]